MTVRSLTLLATFLATLAATPLAAADRSDDLARRRTPVVDVFERCRDAVVNISTTQVVEVRHSSRFDSLFENLFDFPRLHDGTRRFRETSVGSGFVIHEDGFIVTNAHVVARTIERKAIFADGREYEADIVAIDPEHDLAILRIETSEPLRPLSIGRSDDLMVGETVIAIGNPLGYSNTVTAGVVSAIDRALEINGETVYTGLVQTDASINPGNSGGPLLNVLGELIGINTAIRGDAQNIGFALPVDHLREQLPVLLDLERLRNVTVGVRVNPLEDLRVTEVRADSPAERAGLRAGDLLRRIEGQPLSSTIDFQFAMIDRAAGDHVRLEVERDGRTIQASVVLEPTPEPDGRGLAVALYGLHLRPLSTDEATAARRRRGGILIERVDPGSAAADVGIQPGDVLISIGRHEVADTRQLGTLLSNLEPGDVVRMKVYRPSERLAYSGPIRGK